MRTLTVCLTLLSLAAATAGLGADTHRFAPKVFYTSFSAAHPPALRIKSGDRVLTTTVDDLGMDASGTVIAEGPNPQTGPFFIEGAEPGDLIVVTIETLAPNRATGQSTSVMAANAIDPGSITSRPDTNRVSWAIDRARGVVHLDLKTILPRVDWRTRFSGSSFELPLRPTLGSIGVAPAKEALASTQPGAAGGNLVSTGLAAGARVMLPVLQPGALLFLGNGHARQGDGGVTGTGIETSLDVEFSVEVVKRRQWPHSSVARPSTVAGEFDLAWPRVETDDYLMTVGSAPSLLMALQHATIELHHWLDDDFGLSEKAVSVFVGQAIEYEIASIAEGHSTVVAKVRKSYLPRPVAPE